MKKIFLISIFLTSFVGLAIDNIRLGKHLSKIEYGDLDELVRRRYFKVLTNKNSLNYFLHKGKSRGYQYEMIKLFQKELNQKFNLDKGKIKIQFEFIPVGKRDLIPMLVEGKGDIVASGITPEQANHPEIALTRPYKTAHEVIVKRKDVDIGELEEVDFIRPGSQAVHEDNLFFGEISAELGNNEHLIPMKFEGKDAESEELIMELISLGKYKAAFIRSDYAELGVKAFDNLQIVEKDKVDTDLEISWAVRKGDAQLLDALNTFIPKIKSGSFLGNIISNKYFEELNLIKSDGLDLGKHHISKYDSHIKNYSEMYGLDWRLMAALCYQESRFRQDIKNQWGAIGLFQVKQMTADEPYINISEIEGPENYENNIHAGIKYVHWIKNRYFDEYEGMSEKNKVRMAIASYNAGPARIRKAIALAKKMGLNHLKWFRNVESALIKMKRTEPVHYVSEINKRYVAYQLLGIEPD